MGIKIDRIPLDEVAQALETTPLNVLMHIKRGLLEGFEDENGWSVSGESLMLLLARKGRSKTDVICESGCGHAGGCSGCS